MPEGHSDSSPYTARGKGHHTMVRKNLGSGIIRELMSGNTDERGPTPLLILSREITKESGLASHQLSKISIMATPDRLDRLRLAMTAAAESLAREPALGDDQSRPPAPGDLYVFDSAGDAALEWLVVREH